MRMERSALFLRRRRGKSWIGRGFNGQIEKEEL
jgi:hypothetical protein